jgi:hypothetical protein
MAVYGTGTDGTVVITVAGGMEEAALGTLMKPSTAPTTPTSTGTGTGILRETSSVKEISTVMPGASREEVLRVAAKMVPSGVAADLRATGESSTLGIRVIADPFFGSLL